MKIFEGKNFLKLQEKLRIVKNLVIIGHKNPDGDCLGATFALNEFFKLKGYNTNLVVPNEIPDFLKWIDGFENVLIYEKQKAQVEKVISEAELVFLVDFNSLARINNLESVINEAKADKIVIDHHREPENFTEFLFVDIERSSASELVYEFMKKIDGSVINKQVAEFVFLGISSDTGNFMYSSANSQTFSIAAEILKFNINKERIIKGLYNNYSFSRMQLVGDVLLNRIVYLKAKRTAYVYITEEMKKVHNYSTGDQEGIVNMPLTISDVDFSVLFFETKEEIRLSLRSVGEFDVNKIVRKYYQGGGHKNAAGGKSNLTLTETLKFFEDNIDEIIKIATT